MRYILTNIDGSIEIVGCRPIRLIRNSDSAEFEVRGSRKRDGRVVLYGGWTDGTGEEIDVGAEGFDLSDMEADSLAGFTAVFRDVPSLIAKKHPVNAALVAAGRVASKQELINSGIAAPDEKGRLRHDHTFRAAWKDNGTVQVDMPKAREIHMERIRKARDVKLKETDDVVSALDGGPIPAELKALRKKLRDIPQEFDLSQAATPEQLKALWPAELEP